MGCHDQVSSGAPCGTASQPATASWVREIFTEKPGDLASFGGEHLNLQESFRHQIAMNGGRWPGAWELFRRTSGDTLW